MAKLIVANWKMNPATAAEAIKLAQASDVANVIIAPPFLFLPAVKEQLHFAKMAAQDVYGGIGKTGPFTGEVSASQLADAGVRYVIVGHSERRQLLNETDDMVAHKVAAVLKQQLTPIVCIGETKEQRDTGQSLAVVERQLQHALHYLKNPAQRVLVAYEPIWAISTSEDAQPDTPGNAAEMAAHIGKVAQRVRCMVQVLYGGSVTGENAKVFLRQKNIAGALVGGASLKKEEIKNISAIAASL